MNLSNIALAAFLLLSLTIGHADGFEAREYKNSEGNSLPYQLLKPKDYNPKNKYPMLIFLHGSGERGTDNERQLIHSRKLLISAATEHQSFAIAPQCPKGIRWVEVHWAAASHIMPVTASEPMRLLLELLASLEQEFSLDTHRRYVIGLSMGGFGVWDCLCRYPEMFAAGVPVCGGGDETKAHLIKNIPVWVFHGSMDTVVQPIRSRNMVAAIKTAGGSPLYTEYQGVAHNSWVPAFQEPGLLNWLFEQKR